MAIAHKPNPRTRYVRTLSPVHAAPHQQMGPVTGVRPEVLGTSPRGRRRRDRAPMFQHVGRCAAPPRE
ncbi:uncharacterized protein CC84DRAFT_1159358 [Paraphaeosphaeria sporulosa]|uniref:Uncharacterized protein n=1 Tax=Paraphaeosphaeria sporulosa TaxID=1460663 RepID=A0A177CWQ4_9PLEO|nr:uncharacterized protein CC84DRAFT_1159358 [Paraphaeosphaeria sporulosa]OAG11943.1 hypothetical protein CC84DRAFT_1159358 [Paraphaeosphaeria sporulosa]